MEDYLRAITRLTDTTLRSVIGAHELDAVLLDREMHDATIRSIMDEASRSWGVEMTRMELTRVELPEEIRRAIARETEAEHERRARVLDADGELEAARRYVKAASVLSSQPGAMQLRAQALVRRTTESPRDAGGKSVTENGSARA